MPMALRQQCRGIEQQTSGGTSPPANKHAMTFWTYQHLATVTHGSWLVEPDDPAAEVAGLWHDTRELKPGQAYLAIKGENFDGHDFIDQAFDAGASLAIVQADPRVPRPLAGRDASSITSPGRHAAGAPMPVLKVDDTVKALQDLARSYRDELAVGGCKVIGIAGSNGKTTTRHLIHHILTHAGLTGTQSPKSFNNHLGVPLTLLSGKPQDDFLACEIGTNHPGEIDFLSAIVRPDIAVITSIGEEHLAFFKDLEGVAKEESSILEHIEPRGVAITPGKWDYEHDFDLSAKWLSRIPQKVSSIRIGEFEFESEIDGANCKWFSGNYSHESTIAPQPFVVWQSGLPDGYERIGECMLNLSGQHNIVNAIHAFAVASQFELNLEDLADGFATITPEVGRGQIHQFKDIELIHDAYNANPDSMIHAIQMLVDGYAKSALRRIVVLGDMYELGEQSASSHEKVIDHVTTYNPDTIYPSHVVNRRRIDLVVLVGEQFCSSISPIRTRWDRGGRDRIHCFPAWSDDLPDQVAALLEPGDTVLLKASRAIGLERLIPAIERRFGPPPQESPT